MSHLVVVRTTVHSVPRVVASLVPGHDGPQDEERESRERANRVREESEESASEQIECSTVD